MTRPVVCSPLLAEQLAVRGRVATPVVRSGRGPTGRLATGSDGSTGPVLVVGVAGALAPELRPGDLVVADELRTGATIRAAYAAPLLAATVRALGFGARVGPVLSTERVVLGPGERAALAATGALVVDTESAFVTQDAPAGQGLALRAVVDTATAPLLRPGTVWRGLQALRALHGAAPAVDAWAAATGDREVLIAGPGGVRCVARDCDLVLVVGSQTSSDSLRLAEVARGEGPTTHLVDDACEVDLRWLAGARTVGIVAGASASHHLVDELVRALSGLGRVSVRERVPADEDVRSALPREVS